MAGGVIRTTCPYCGVGCGLRVASDGTLTGDPEHPANYGRLCSKGAALTDTLATDGRLLYPQIGSRNANWDEALDRIAAEFTRVIDQYGPDSVALYAIDLFEAALDGRTKALWILSTNPAASMPRAERVRAALEACPFVVVSDCWPTDTTRFADVVLPAAGWGEKDGTVTNSERCISRQRAFRPPPGEARPDWWMLAAVVRRMGWTAAFDYRGPADIFREHAALSAFENTEPHRRIFDLGAS